jgi:hypothetical protein
MTSGYIFYGFDVIREVVGSDLYGALNPLFTYSSLLLVPVTSFKFLGRRKTDTTPPITGILN